MDNTVGDSLCDFMSQVDKIGRILIPAQLRKQLTFTPQTDIVLKVVEEGLLITHPQKSCRICGQPVSVADYHVLEHNVWICRGCLAKLSTE